MRLPTRLTSALLGLLVLALAPGPAAAHGAPGQGAPTGPSPTPAFRAPAPGGPYAVGSRWLALVDSTRVDSLAPPTPGPRQLLARVW